jgi:NADH:ubiquinone oxidoreductase subunit 2 (subunit N)
MSLKLNFATARLDRREARAEILRLKQHAGSAPGNLQLRPVALAEVPKPHPDQFPFATRFAVINLIGLALIAAAWAENLLAKPFKADTSGMCYLLVALFLAGLVAVYRKDWQTVRWAGNALVYLGMVGTVLGLIMTVSDLSVDKAQNFDSFKAIVTAIYIGSGTALYTNLIACIGYLWLGTNAHLLARQEV